MIENNILDPLKTQSYNYTLPEELIAKSPASPPDSAKLLVYEKKTKQIVHTTFKNILDFIPKNTNIYLNDTKVIKARIFGKKSTGGKIELLFNKALENNIHLVMIKGKVKINSILYFSGDLSAKVLSINLDGSKEVIFFENNNIKNTLDFLELNEILEKIGHVPLPPYIQREDKKSDEIDYQSLFAKNIGAVASPTASLHFTKELLKTMQEKFNTYYLTLHIGAGTFKPIDKEDILKHQIHSEYFNLPKLSEKSLLEAKKDNKNIMAVGTTVTRVLEYYKKTSKTSGTCDLFLHPNSTPKLVDLLLTNFHLPKSTLIMLVSSFIGLEETLRIYEDAIKNKYRFYSYGDAMLIL